MNKLRPRERSASLRVIHVCARQCQNQVPTPEPGLGGPEQQGLLIYRPVFRKSESLLWDGPQEAVQGTLSWWSRAEAFFTWPITLHTAQAP